MLRYFLTRLAMLIPVMFGVSVLVFASLYLTPGDPVSAVVGDIPISEETRSQLSRQYGFDKPLVTQYLSFLSRTVRGDLGYSYRSGQPVGALIAQNLPLTLELMVSAMVLAILVGTVLGTLAALNHGRALDTLLMTVATLGLSVPTFWLGMLLLLIFAVRLGWVPAIGSEGFSSLILPSVTIGLAVACILARFLRGSLLEVLGQDYIITARSKGAGERRVVLGHAFRNAVIPVLTIVGLQVGNLLAGAVVVETIFTRHGIGELLLSGITNRDFPVVQGTVLFAALGYVAVNLAVDLLYSVIDPRIRHARRLA
jgi:peptide/nickel transport system permease protein